MESVDIVKASGVREPFNEEKLRASLEASDADQELVEQVLETVRNQLYEGMTTQKIYREAFKLLKKKSQHAAGRYRLKQAILDLGPTGYPFERFIGEVLRRSGFTAETGVVVEGVCVSHEIDVIAEKDDTWYLVECKFHNKKEDRSNVKVPLYIHSRFKDVETNWRKQPGHENKAHQGWVVTNTRFTKDAIQFAECSGLRLLSWDYPRKRGLKDVINRVDLHPVTCMSSLTKKEKETLLSADVILCIQLIEQENHLNQLELDSRKRKRVLAEAKDICDGNGHWTTS